MAFASFAYRITRGDSYDGGRISGVPQFGGVLYSDDRVTLFPNTSAYYTGPALFNLHFTAAMKSVQAEGAPDHVEIINAPLPASEAELRFLRAVSTLAMALTVMSAYSFIATGIAGYVVMEREKEVKHQLMVSGTTRFAYWLSNFVFDSIFGLFSCVSTLIILAIFGGSTWCTFPNINATVALLLLFVPAVNAFAYFWSHFFETSGGALVGVLMLNLFLGSFGLQISYALLFFPKTRLAGRIILWVTRALLPSVCVGDGLLNLALYKDISRMLGLSPFSGFIFGSEYCAPENAGMPCIANAGDDCIMLVFSAALYSFLFTAADWISEHPGCRFRLSPDPICPWELRRQEDENVRAEKARVAKLDPSTQVLMVDGVSKVYTSSRGAVHAVRGVSFAVDAGNVFGLLGTNGAGKTTTFKMICGQLPPSSGRIFVKGLDVSEDLQGVRSHIGYCPQFDALLEHMTVREHLELFARVKGFGGPALEAECLEKQRTLRLEEYADSRAGQLSGGNKRKLQTAIALVGEPEVVFLDEPSAGMDPLARRRMWDVIQRVAMSRRSSAVVLTTHSMEEADALCTRIGIQCSGQLRCLGSPQQLKEWYGTGLELNLRLEPPTHPEGARLCRDWGVGPEEALRLGQAQQFVDCFFANRKLDPRGPPLKGETDSMVAAALAEWCLQEERAEGLAAFLEQTCGGKDKAACVERAAGSARYRLSGDCPGGGPRPYAELFERLEEQRGPLRLADFQLSQGTLEQTFNRLAAEDIALREEDDPDGGDHT